MYTDYLYAVRDALKQTPDEWRFKSDPRYRTVLEHTPVEFARILLDWSLKADLSMNLVRDLCELNDSVGQPVQEQIADLGTYSTGNMRYLAHAIKLWRYVESLNVPEVEVVEIGGGFGGLALWVRGLAGYFNARIGAYWIVDLPEVTVLQHQVLQQLGVSAFPVNNDSPAFGIFAKRSLPLVCMSAYAFSEFDQATRDFYAERLLSHCRHGLMVWNFADYARQGYDGRWFGGPPYPFVQWPMTIVPDEPALYDGHLHVTW